MTNKQELIAYLKKTKVPYNTYSIAVDGAEFLCDVAVKLGAIICINPRGTVDFYFNSKGKLVGTATDSRDSFIGRETKKAVKGKAK